MDRGLVTFPHVGGFGSGRQDPDVTGQVLQWRVRNPVPEKSPADQGQETGTGLTGLRRAGPEPANRSAAPPAKRRIFPDTLTSCACCYVSAAAGCLGVVCSDRFERFPSFLWSLRASPLIFASSLSSPLRENPAETMNLFPGLRRFGFCGQQVAVFLRSVAGPVFPPPFAL